MPNAATATHAKTYRLTRKFAIGSLVVTAAAAVALAFANRDMSVGQLERMAQQNNAALTQAVANTLWPRYRMFINDARKLAPDALRGDERTGALHRSVAALLAGTRVLKVKLYDLGGLTVFSTEAAQIGADYGTNQRFLEAIGGRTPSSLEFRARFDALDGPVANRWVLSSYVPVRPSGPGGQIEGVAEIYSDVTDIVAYMRDTELVQIGLIGGAFFLVFLLLLSMVWRAELQIRRVHAENIDLAAARARADAASQAKTEFLANMSHELRTPLNAIIGFAEMIKGAALGPVGDQRYLDYAADIHRSGSHLLRIISDVLDLVNIDSGRTAASYGSVEPAALAGEVARLFERDLADKGVTLTLALDGAGGPFVCDDAKLRQILLNLLSNAAAYTESGGSVTLAISANGATDEIEIEVSDTGIGIAPEDMPAALAPFGRIGETETSTQGGVGLGLPLTREYAELLGGRFHISSTPGAGTHVGVALPRHPKAVSGEPLATAA